MRMWLIGSLIAVVVLVFAVFPGLRRLTQTVWLIVQVKPYERVVADAPSILVAGDSTAYGTGAAAGTKTLAGYIGNDFPSYTIKNTSVNGRTIGGLREALAEVLEQKRYAAILFQIGGNDIIQQRSVEAVEADLRAVLTEAKQHTNEVLMMSSGNVGAAPAYAKNGQPNAEYETITRAMRDMFIQVNDELGTTYIDLFLEPEQDVFLQQPRKYIAMDGLHPNAAGYYFWYQSVRPELEKALERYATE